MASERLRGQRTGSCSDRGGTVNELLSGVNHQKVSSSLRRGHPSFYPIPQDEAKEAMVFPQRSDALLSTYRTLKGVYTLLRAMAL